MPRFTNHQLIGQRSLLDRMNSLVEKSEKTHITYYGDNGGYCFGIGHTAGTAIYRRRITEYNAIRDEIDRIPLAEFPQALEQMRKEEIASAIPNTLNTQENKVTSSSILANFDSIAMLQAGSSEKKLRHLYSERQWKFMIFI